MPNLAEIVQEVHDALDFNPGLDAYKDAIVRRVNRKYLEISDAAPWLFLQVKADMTVYATVTGSATSTVAVLSAEPREVDGVGTAFGSHYDGQTFVGPDGADYIIAYAALPAVMVLTTDYSTLPLTANASWSVRFDRYSLPADCNEVLGITSRDDDRGRLVFIDRRTEEKLFLDKDNTGDPWVGVQDDYLNLRAPVGAPVLGAQNRGTYAANDLLASTEYEYRYTWFTQGLEGPPSPVASVTTNASSGGSVDVYVDDTRYRLPSNSIVGDSGIRSYLYRRDVTNSGRWIRVADIAPGASPYSDEHLLPPSYDDRIAVPVFEEQGPREYIRMWTTAGSDLTVELRYLRRPKKLAADSQAPEWPVQYHHILIFHAIADTLRQHGATEEAKVWDARGERLLQRMRGRYLSKTDNLVRRGSFDRTFRSGRYSNLGTPSRS